MPRQQPATMKMIATKARRHKGFIYKKPSSVTLCLCALVAIFIGNKNASEGV